MKVNGVNHISNPHEQSMPDYYENYKELAIAIVESAVHDYINTSSENRILAIRNFFMSEWYKILCNIDGHYMIKLCEKKRRERIDGEKNYRNDCIRIEEIYKSFN